MTQPTTSHPPSVAVSRIGRPDEVLAGEHIRAFVHDQLDAAHLEAAGRAAAEEP